MRDAREREQGERDAAEAEGQRTRDELQRKQSEYTRVRMQRERASTLQQKQGFRIQLRFPGAGILY